MPRPALLVLLTCLLTGCASNIVDTDLLVSNTLLLPPSSAKAVFIQSRNSSDNQQVTLNDLESRLTAKGYRVVTDPDTAQYLVFTNIVYCNQTRPDLPVETMVASGYGSGFGSSLLSGLSGLAGMAGSVAAMHPAAGAGWGLGQMVIGGVSSVLGGLSGMFGSSSPAPQPRVSDEIIYACVADLQIIDRSQSSGGVSPAAPKPGSSPPPGVYQTRLGASVHQRKLKVEEATPLVQSRLSAAVAGHF